MKHILMSATRRVEGHGVLREGKSYIVPGNVADGLIGEGHAKDLSKPVVERAVSAATEDAAKVTKRKTRARKAKPKPEADNE